MVIYLQIVSPYNYKTGSPKMKIPTTGKRTKILSVIATLAAVLLIAYTAYAWQSSTWPFAPLVDSSTENSSSTEGDQTDDTFVDDSPATAEDQEDANRHKQEEYERQQADRDNDDRDAPDSQSEVSVTLTTFYIEDDELRANGFVTGVIESGGTCTLIVTNQAGKSVSTSRPGHNNATNTTCGQSTIKLSKLSPGRWTPELRYTSEAAKGTTGPRAWEAIEVK